jgi:cell division septation protein DedD
MKYNLEDARAGTTCTFTGRGSRDKKGRLAQALIVSGFAAIFVFGIGVAFFMAQTSSRLSPVPSGGPAMTSGVSAPSGPHSQSLSASKPIISSSPSAGQVRSGETPRGPSGPSRFRVQSGSFVNRDNAVSLIMRLRDHGYAVALIPGKLYRVWVGGYLDRTKAERLAANLRATGFDATLIPR